VLVRGLQLLRLGVGKSLLELRPEHPTKYGGLVNNSLSVISEVCRMSLGDALLRAKVDVCMASKSTEIAT